MDKLDVNANKETLCAKKLYKKLNVYVSGYGPFMNIRENPSQKLVEYIIQNKENIHKSLDEKCQIVHEKIYDVCVDYVKENVKHCHSCIQEELNKNSIEGLHLIIHFGVHSGSDKIHLERKAKNKIKDYRKYDCEIRNDGQDELMCKLDLENLADTLRQNNHKIGTSDDAGTYLCNFIYYQSADTFKECENVIPLFIHIPDLNVCSTEDCHNCFVDFLKVLVDKYIV
jgi:pyroglutamyl-peptidase